MKDEEKPKEQLIAELLKMRERIKELEGVKEKLDNALGELEICRLYRCVVDCLPICTIIYDKKEKVIYRNQITKFIDGYEDEELLGLSREEYLGKLQIKPGSPVKMIVPQHKAEGFNNGIFGLTETTLLAKGGVLKDVLLIGNIINDDKNNILGACGSAIDITEHVRKRNRAKKALKEQLLFVQKLIDTIPNPVFYKDVKGLYQGCNKAFEEYVGLSREEIIGKAVHEMFPKELADKYYEMDSALFREQGIQVYENHVLHADGTIHNVVFNKATYSMEDGEVSGLIGVISDITEYKRAEEALRLSEERFFKAFNSNPIPMALISLKAGRFIDVNNAFLRSTGYCSGEILGRTPMEVGIYENEGYQKNTKQVLMEQGFVQNLEIKFKTSKGNLRYGLFSAELINLENDQCLLCSINDITERKHLEKEMARLDRLNLIGQMAAGIGHEIRNPMTSVRGLLQVLAGKEDCSQYKDYYKLMIGELDRANWIITEFLSVAKNKPMDLKMQNINSIVEALNPLLMADAINSNINIALKLGPVSDLLLNEKEIRQLILNLARNGMEAMSLGGYLTIETYANVKEVVLSVRDQGKGIDSGVLEKIGTPFFTTKEQGTGLGLAVCFSIAARHNARVELKTGLTGTTFFVRFKLG